MSKLIDTKTGEPLHANQTVHLHNGGTARLLSWKPPTQPGSTGRVLVQMFGDGMQREFFPAAIGAEIVADEHDTDSQ